MAATRTLCAGAPIPGSLVQQARAVLGTKIVSAWGMTENGAVTLIELDDDDELAFTTDGCPLPGVGDSAFSAAAGSALLAWKNGVELTFVFVGASPVVQTQMDLAKAAIARL